MTPSPRAIAAWMNELARSAPAGFDATALRDMLERARDACPGMAVDRCPKCRRWDVESHCIDGGLDGERWACAVPLVRMGQGMYEYEPAWRAGR